MNNREDRREGGRLRPRWTKPPHLLIVYETPLNCVSMPAINPGQHKVESRMLCEISREPCFVSLRRRFQHPPPLRTSRGGWLTSLPALEPSILALPSILADTVCSWQCLGLL